MLGAGIGLAAGHGGDDLVAELADVGGLDGIVLHHVQRVLPEDLVQLGQRPPGAADSAERAARMPVREF